MGRDYKPRADRKSAARRGSARGGTLIGLFIGLVFGVIFALGIAWYINRTPIPFMTAKSGKPAAEMPAEPDKPEKPEKPEKAAKPAVTPGQPVALPGKPGDKPLEKLRFDFYKILPEGEGSTKAGDKPAAILRCRTSSILQLGAFLNPADADNLKAKVALMGLEASVQKIENAEGHHAPCAGGALSGAGGDGKHTLATGAERNLGHAGQNQAQTQGRTAATGRRGCGKTVDRRKAGEGTHA